jgi:hypothetical protein
MDLLESTERLMQINASVDMKLWDNNLTSAVQRALAEIYLLNLHDDVDGLVGPRTRAAWHFFQEAMNQQTSNAIDETSARLLVTTLDNPGRLLGNSKVSLERDFEFQRQTSQANRATSLPSLIQAPLNRQLVDPQIA